VLLVVAEARLALMAMALTEGMLTGVRPVQAAVAVAQTAGVLEQTLHQLS